MADIPSPTRCSFPKGWDGARCPWPVLLSKPLMRVIILSILSPNVASMTENC
jgi:hypothetical protein